jgi:hypothetical protein
LACADPNPHTPPLIASGTFLPPGVVRAIGDPDLAPQT